ncbi:MAG: helix-turn-helix transcriptional regulator [Pantoea sp.]|uniref:AraC family transcriptional regulator n=1 Tax=unclassified Pantoea TaxID=2630326 RepID=UPI0023A3692F|nr:helix-turn-helix transcriptional regulator [Pantoea sp.]MDE1186626.1 helix-turn-helix transcriptional regulator [Pantoea sp.]
MVLNKPRLTDASPTLPLLTTREMHYHAGREERWHAHEVAQLVLCLQGVMRVQTHSASWTLTPGRALWLPGTLPHALTALSDIRSLSLYLEPVVARAFWPEARSMMISPLLQALMQTLVEMEQQSNPDPLRVELITPLLLDEIHRAPEGPVCVLPLPADRRLMNICQQLLQTPASSDTLEEWGHRVGASSRTLARLFRDQTGITFTQWRQQLRLSEALVQLAQGQPVLRIASQLGYQSPSAFISMFRRLLGDTPQRFLRISG